ncbi:hypothetical protein F2P81_021477 [Scophthalmus maximus]|uniref:BHLH domain-containing protein n=1 Tax=Scophthalmus maximus TaxID=52904 RepID=A0A6A4S5D2_SCOMX|nr:hypothetical protein F2P81_021477 [Scophthalmus maximus]
MTLSVRMTSHMKKTKLDYNSEDESTSEETMNVLSNPVIRAQEQSRPLCGPGTVQDLPHCPPGFHLSSRLHPAPLLGLQSSPRSTKPQRELSPEEQQELRRKINSRERKRMQDLNIAMDALREVMVPYASSPSPASSSQSHHPGAPPGRRLSKISTLVLARNYILLLGSSLQEMRRLLGEVSIGMGVNPGPVPRLLLTGVMVGPLHLHTFACRQTELLLTASRADCLPGPRPNPVGMVTRDGEKTWRGRLAARPASLDKSLSETSLQWTDVNSNDLQMSLSEGQQKEVALAIIFQDSLTRQYSKLNSCTVEKYFPPNKEFLGPGTMNRILF